jgi:chromosome segregation ATPase
MNSGVSAGSYGEKRERGASVSYLEIEKAATELLLAGDTPSAAKVRKALGDRGSQQTLLDGLQRFRRDLGLKISGDPAALSRLPIEIAEAVETIWQRALRLASQSAKSDENQAQQHLERLRIANEVRDHSLTLREKEMETQTRERESALADSRDQLLGALRSLTKAQEELKFKERRIASLQAEVASSQAQLASVLSAVVKRNQATKKKPVKRAASRGASSKAKRVPPRVKRIPRSPRRKPR